MPSSHSGWGSNWVFVKNPEFVLESWKLNWSKLVKGLLRMSAIRAPTGMWLLEFGSWPKSTLWLGLPKHNKLFVGLILVKVGSQHTSLTQVQTSVAWRFYDFYLLYWKSAGLGWLHRESHKPVKLHCEYMVPGRLHLKSHGASLIFWTAGGGPISDLGGGPERALLSLQRGPKARWLFHRDRFI